MLKKSTLIHLRLPFSIFLMPVFLFALSQLHTTAWGNVLLVFIILHLFLYPASNAFNSYYDKDEESIGGIEKPPPVTKELLYVSLILDGVAILLGLLLNVKFAILLFIYGLVSKAYSHPTIRLKKFPIVSLLVIGFFQGFFTYYMVYEALAADVIFSQILIPAILSSLLLLACYPLTQIYQHKEDARRGDKTISRILGIKGTFIFAGVMFFVANAAFLGYFLIYKKNIWEAVIFQACLLPSILFFGWWFMKTLKNEARANFRNTMRLNALSSLGLNVGFLGIWLMRLF